MAKPRLLYEEGTHLHDVDGKAAETLDWEEFCTRLHLARNRFLRVYVCSRRNERLRKTGNPFLDREVRKVYVYTVRNGFNFHEAVEREVARNGGNPATVERHGRSWGRHLNGGPFVIHHHKTDGPRLHAHFMPVKQYHAEYTGYYVDGVKIDDTEMAPFVPGRPEPTTPAEMAKAKLHPINSRLEDILYVKLSGKFYRIKCPSALEVAQLAEGAEQHEPAA